jgi:hypothetical protein
VGGLAEGFVDTQGGNPAEQVAGFTDVNLQVAAEALAMAGLPKARLRRCSSSFSASSHAIFPFFLDGLAQVAFEVSQDLAATGNGNATFWGRERVQRRFLSAFMVLFLFISHIGRTIVVGVLCNRNNSLIRRAISSLACRNNLISDAVNIRGVEQVTCFRLCKAVKSPKPKRCCHQCSRLLPR